MAVKDLYSALELSPLTQIPCLLIYPWALPLVKLRVLNTGQPYVGNPSLGVPAVHNHSNPPVPIYKVLNESFHTSYMLLEAVVLTAY